jgi:hypothetical protein
MTDPNVRTLGMVADIDGMRLRVGVDYDSVVVGGCRFNSTQAGTLARLFNLACEQAAEYAEEEVNNMTEDTGFAPADDEPQDAPAADDSDDDAEAADEAPAAE